MPYGTRPQYSYFDGCSGEGRDRPSGRHPDTLTNLTARLAGASQPTFAVFKAWALWLCDSKLQGSGRLHPAGQIVAMIHRFVLDAQAHAKDGLKDGLISDPEHCNANFNGLQCKAAMTPLIASPRAKSTTAQTIVSPATTPSGKVLFPRLEPGTELAWARSGRWPAACRSLLR